ncbi:methyl-accepting chemotaxis protein [[Clostridium] polysaccharolyticum]|uniref:Methyl-accepting chemotaxis protein n=1 Tax=[Clostridium] polysaccharolyticum TaxID=29364 RepID=A0A1H9ZYH3_9FIRM|nr:methyl-accepting chemotaxis protein [[Clostridium] polysaccharolyticum]SES86801.1 methyl-accepting chemotaxis protein [[Clostridium] polysaccharolyticum]
MENLRSHIKRCNKLLFIVVMFLCSFYLVNVAMYYTMGGDFKSGLLVVTLIVMALESAAYLKLRASRAALYVLSGLFFVNYCATLVIFIDACYYTYMFAVIFVAMLYFDLKFIIISTVLTEIATFCNIAYKVKVLGIFHKVEFIYMPLMIGIMFVVYYIGTILLNRFMTESHDELAEASEKSENTAKQVVTTVTEINHKFNSIMEELKEINQQADNNNTSMRAIADSTEETVGEITHQANMTTDIQTAIVKTMENVETVHKTTLEVLEIIKNGIGLAQELTVQSKSVNGNTSQMTQIIQALVGRVRDVSEITNAIFSISNQTNLLALNASIEAARAGDAGKGFAVVADEIRNLSDETKTSTQQITDIIAELSQVTDNTMSILQESVTNINKQNQKIVEVNKSFSTSGDFMNELKLLIDGIVKDINTISESNKTIVNSINQLSATTEEISSCSQESSTSSARISDRIEVFTKEIQKVSQDLNQLVQNI